MANTAGVLALSSAVATLEQLLFVSFNQIFIHFQTEILNTNQSSKNNILMKQHA